MTRDRPLDPDAHLGLRVVHDAGRIGRDRPSAAFAGPVGHVLEALVRVARDGPEDPRGRCGKGACDKKRPCPPTRRKEAARAKGSGYPHGNDEREGDEGGRRLALRLGSFDRAKDGGLGVPEPEARVREDSDGGGKAGAGGEETARPEGQRALAGGRCTWGLS